ncbi:hypothetical protein [Burkholderia anthina]|uniref:hypothetical protein n=1 Tax=Burkholderia anthina TaxID=179879 RepID=UPI00158D4283|nr:hypothetical protein [Burkholderia anthina]
MKLRLNALLALALAMVPAFASAKVQGTGIAIADVTLERIRVAREDRAIDDARHVAKRQLPTAPPKRTGDQGRDTESALPR